MGKRLYVGNLPYSAGNEDLQELFRAHGAVTYCQVILDRTTGRSKGFGFVEMANDQQARTALQAVNGQDLDGRTLTVTEARPREERGDSARNRDAAGGGRRY